MTAELFDYDNGTGTPTAQFVTATEVATSTPQPKLRTTPPRTTRGLVTQPKTPLLNAKLQQLDTPSLPGLAPIPATSSPSELNPVLTSIRSLNQANAAVPWLNNQSTLTV